MSGIKDLRDFLAVLKDNKLLFETERAVDWKYEIGSLLATLEAEGQRTGLFHNIKDKEFSVCGNVLASMDGIALALGCRKDEMTDFLADCLEHPVKPQVVADAPCHENIRMGDEIDLERIPVPKGRRPHHHRRGDCQQGDRRNPPEPVLPEDACEGEG